MRRRVLVLLTALVGATVFVSGFFAYPLLVPPQKNMANEGIPLGGYVVIEAYHANGTHFASWQGHNSLTLNGIGGVAACMSGQDLPSTLGTNCYGVIADVEVDDGGAGSYNGAATDTLYPLGCNPNSNPSTCTGWQTKGTINFSTGTFPDTIINAGTLTQAGYLFDGVSITHITVNQGDYLTVTVTFTIT